MKENLKKEMYKQHMKTIYSNVNGLISKLREMTVILRGRRPQPVCLIYTKLGSSTTNNTLSFENYNIRKKERVTRQGEVIIIETEKCL